MNDLHKYWEHRDQLDNADLLTYDTEGSVSWVIQRWSPGANHAGMVLYLEEFSGELSRRWTLDATSHGPRMVFLSEHLERLKGECFWHQLKPEISQAKRRAAMLWALKQQGVVKYDFKAVLQSPFRVISADIDRLLCSEYVQFSWAKGKIISMRLNALISMPSDLPNANVTMPPILLVTHKPFIQVPLEFAAVNP